MPCGVVAAPRNARCSKTMTAATTDRGGTSRTWSDRETARSAHRGFRSRDAAGAGHRAGDCGSELVKRWQARWRLVVMAAVAIAAGLLVPWLPDDAGRDVLAGGLVLGGLAMLVVALTDTDGDHKS